MALNEAGILESVHTLYLCADGEVPWSAFLDDLAAKFEAGLVGLSSNAKLQAVVGVDSAELRKYQDHYLRLNPWQYGKAYPVGKALITEDVLPEHAYKRSVFYNEWGKKNEVVHGVGGAVQATADMTLFLSVNPETRAGRSATIIGSKCSCCCLMCRGRLIFTKRFRHSKKIAGSPTSWHGRFSTSQPTGRFCGPTLPALNSFEKAAHFS